MPDYFVDGQREGSPAQTLLIHAANADAAIARASELGLTPTGARASGMPQELVWSRWAIIGFCVALAFGALAEVFDARASGHHISLTTSLIATTVPFMIVVIRDYLFRCQGQIQTMQLEIDALRERLNARQISSK